MADTEVNVALTALIVAAIALLIAVGQLLQQLFGTADGYRRCQSSVIGAYATRTHRKWRWSEFRFETRYTTPLISLDYLLENSTLRNGIEKHKVTGSDNSRKKTLAPRDDGVTNYQTFDRVGWLSFLQDLHIQQARFTEEDHCSNPTIVFQERSWDFVPPEIVKPLASSTLGAIIVLAHRLDMQWLDFRPNEGVMRAEGPGGLLASMAIRGVGVVFQYNKLYHSGKLRGLVPCEAVDKATFGIVSAIVGDLHMAGPDDSLPAIESALQKLPLSTWGVDIPRLSQQKEWKYGLSDLPGLLTEFIPRHSLESHIKPKIPSPYRWKLESPISWGEGRLCLETHLRRYIETLRSDYSQLDPLKRILAIVDDFRKAYPANWEQLSVEDFRGSDPNRISSLLSACEVAFKETNNILLECLSDLVESSFFMKRILTNFAYGKLLSSQLVTFFRFGETKRKELKDGVKEHRQYGIQDGYNPEYLEYSLVYVELLDAVVAGAKSRFAEREEGAIRLAWWAMMFRGIWWFMSIRKGDPVPVQIDSSWWGSSMPVWIG